MNYFDIIFALIIIWAAIRGFSTGFIIQISSLLAMLTGAFAAYKASFWLASKFSTIINADPVIINTVAFIVTFAIVWGLVILLGKFLHAVVKIAMMGLLNRILGIFFSVLKIVFALSVILILAGNLNKSLNFLPQKHINSSLLYKPVEKFASAIFPYLKTGFNKAQKQWNENQEKDTV
ncbi:MAG: CvpA family protein [Prevotellaceae bacterium]|jgi:membrane protein required for colicin V production|nr:CvpA family protein [Prevotellaceae bacterium]